MSRRGANEGTIRLRPDGRWEARVLVTGPDGRRTRRSLLARTRTEVRAKLADALRTEATGLPHPAERLSVGVFLDQWLRESVCPTVRPSTYVNYASIVRIHLAPGLGHLPLARLTPQQVQAFLNAKSNGKLAPRTVAYMRAVLRQALGQAERWGLVTRNAARLAEPPRVPRREIRPLSPDQARLFIEAIRSDRLEALYLVALGAGLRQGEILGLTWTDIDFEGATLTVRNALQRVNGQLTLVEPKSVTSRRVVALPRVVLDALHAHRTRQRQDRLLAGSRWHDDPRGFVFTTTIGTPMDGIAVTRRFQAVLAGAGLPRQRSTISVTPAPRCSWPRASRRG